MENGQKTYDGLTAKFLAQVAECMPKLEGEVMQGWVENPAALHRALATLDRGEIPHGAEGIAKVIWREVEAGGKPANEVIDRLFEHCDIGNYEPDLAELFEYWLESQPIKPVRLKLVRISPKELGFRKGTYFRRILDSAHDFGLRDIELWMVPYLRLAYLDQSGHETLCLGMEPIHEGDARNAPNGRIELWDADDIGPNFFFNQGDAGPSGHGNMGDLPGYVNGKDDFLFLAAE